MTTPKQQALPFLELPKPPRIADIPDWILHPLFRLGYDACLDHSGAGILLCEYDISTKEHNIWMEGYDYAGRMDWDYAENHICGPATMMPQFRFPVGMRIKFRRDIICRRTTKILAEQGEIGEIISNEGWDGYWVNSSKWPTIGVKIEDFEVLDI